MSENQEKTPLSPEEKWNKRKNFLSFLAIVLAVVLIAYFALGTLHLGIGLVIFVLSTLFAPITG